MEAEEGEWGYTPLTLALVMSYQWVAAELLAMGADPLRMSSRGSCPALVIAEKGLTALVPQVLQRCAAAATTTAQEAKDAKRIRVLMLHIAIENNRNNIVSMIMSHREDINACNQHGNSPLMTALITGNRAAAMMLIKAGANVRVPSLRSQRLPMYATSTFPVVSFFAVFLGWVISYKSAILLS